jgi:pescadillo
MGREQKKGKSGNAKAFISRAKALKKMQLDLPEFRRLCIIKGIHPRDPKKKPDGASVTYYLRKDIDFLMHERLVDTVRASKTHRKKVVKAKARKQLDLLKALVLKTPTANLDHIIVERYPNFSDALRELDDPLCLLSLFATLPASHSHGIAPSRVANCKRLINEFTHYVTRTNALRRVFVSIKGYYYQAEIEGEMMTWVTPHRFSQALPTEVDYSVMLTFLELYECMVNFVNFRLYTSHNLAYPPKVDHCADAAGHDVEALRPEKAMPASTVASKPLLSSAAIAAAKAAAASATNGVIEEEDDEDGAEMDNEVAKSCDEGIVAAIGDDEEPTLLLFSNMVFVVGRETPAPELEFVLKSAGASEVIRQDELGCEEGALEKVTHWVIDRPVVSGSRVMTIEYVQPQYVFDSINAGVMLPPALYAPGAKLPPHLSPFVGDEEDGGYRPWFKDIVERIKAGDTTVMADAAIGKYQRSKRPKGKTGILVADVDGNVDAMTDAVRETAGAEDVDVDEDEEEEMEDGGDEIEEETGDEDHAQHNLSGDETKEDLRLMMMSRKKMKVYSRYAKDEKAKKDRKILLTAKRDRLEADADPAGQSQSSQKKRKRSKSIDNRVS